MNHGLGHERWLAVFPFAVVVVSVAWALLREARDRRQIRRARRLFVCRQYNCPLCTGRAR